MYFYACVCISLPVMYLSVCVCISGHVYIHICKLPHIHTHTLTHTISLPLSLPLSPPPFPPPSLLSLSLSPSYSLPCLLSQGKICSILGNMLRAPGEQVKRVVRDREGGRGVRDREGAGRGFEARRRRD
jgi:hypothetical protein